MTLTTLLMVANGLLATTYGHGEVMCGDIGKPEACQIGATTASGLPFDPAIPFVAIAAPTNFVLHPQLVYLKTKTGRCHALNIIDKMNPRYIGVRGFDVSPAGVALLTGKPATSTWMEPLYICNPKPNKVKSKKHH